MTWRLISGRPWEGERAAVRVRRNVSDYCGLHYRQALMRGGGGGGGGGGGSGGEAHDVQVAIGGGGGAGWDWAVGPGGHCLPHHPTHLNPFSLTQMASDDVASNTCRALLCG